jgi:dimeric dUTPase (all-alpha-NTP-PPase superfamily)
MNFDDLLESAVTRIALRLSTAEEEYLAIAGETLSKIYGLSSDPLLQYLEYLSADEKKLDSILEKANIENKADMKNLFNDITDTVYQEGTSIAVEKGQHLLPFDVFKSTFNPMLNDVMDHYETMAKSTTVNEGYRDTIKHFVNRLTLDDDRINGPTAMRKAIKSLVDQGISVIEYDNEGNITRRRMDSAVRNAMMTEYSNIVQGVQNRLGEDLQMDGVEVSTHAHSSPDHEPFQGHFFSNAEFEKLQNGDIAEDVDGEKFQTDRAIGQWNCRHIYYPVFLNISEPSFSREQLEDIKQDNDDGVDFHGDHYSLYEAEQLQRKYEVELRHEKERLNLLRQVRKTAPELEGDYYRSRAKIDGLKSEYEQLGKTLAPHHIRMKPERASIPRGSTGNAKLPVR